ncbi:unnamed protein product [Cylindrotheca closterium]|uniref:Uncharacterized protein n=1 Tax=Cylindrotheca closterium TaxID=2856 RepID=A0AAD2G239_9STRA|nr:unnamed protein product [Cylindrotheca closterium]
MVLFLPNPLVYNSSITTKNSGIPLNVSQQVSGVSQALHNDSIQKLFELEYQDQSKNQENNVSDPMMVDEKESDRSLWESLWRHYVPADATNGTKEVPIEERQRLWQPLLDSNEATQFAMSDLYAAFPLPQGDTVQRYNEDAYRRLISSILQAQKEGRNFTIVASGGSSTAGGAKPAISQEDRYYSKFAEYLNVLLASNQMQHVPPIIQWVGQGHGFRNSLHTAIFFENFIPADTDLLIWEFSINDVTLSIVDHDLIMTIAKDNFLARLTQVKMMKRPPKVLLIYKWENMFPHDEKTNNVISRAFDAHGTVARKFDFVVGHVHMGSYIDKLKMPECNEYESCPFLADYTHINKLGHLATAFLLLNLMDPRRLDSSSDPNESNLDSANYEWDCGEETEVKRVLKQTMTTSNNFTTEWRPPLGAWTSELPIFNQVTQRSLQTGSRMGKFNLIGKQDPLREDRQRATPLYKCNVNESSSFSLRAPLEPMRNVRLVLLTVRIRPVLNTKGIDFRLNRSNITTKGELVPLRAYIRSSIMDNEWRCGLVVPWGDTVDIYVYIFEEPQQLVHSIELCTPKKFTRRPQVQSLAFW